MKIVINGAGEIGSHLAKLLSKEGSEVTVIDSDEKRIEALGSVADVGTVIGEPSSLSALVTAGVPKADLFISVVPYVDQEVNIVSSIFAKKLGAKKVVARIQNMELLKSDSRKMLKELEIDHIFCPEKIASDEIVDQIHRASSTDVLELMGGKLHIATYRLSEDSPILDMKLVDFTAQFTPEEASQFRVIAIQRDGKTMIPKFDTNFKFGDVVYVITKKSGMRKLSEFLGVIDIDIDKVMIMGGGSVGSLTALSLYGDIEDIKVIEINHDRCVELDEMLSDTILVVNGDGRNSDFLYEESIKDYDAFVAVTGNDEANILACVAAKKFGVLRTIAEVENLEYVRLAEEMGIDFVINKKLATAGRVFKMTLSDRARFVRYMSGTDAEVLEYTAAPDSAITKATLMDLDFPSNAVVGGVIRAGETIIPVGSTQVQANDRVVVFAMPSAVKSVDKLFK